MKTRAFCLTKAAIAAVILSSWTHMWPQMGWNCVGIIWISTCPTLIHFPHFNILSRQKWRILYIACIPQLLQPPRHATTLPKSYFAAHTSHPVTQATCLVSSVLPGFNELTEHGLWSPDTYTSVWQIHKKYDSPLLAAL